MKNKILTFIISFCIAITLTINFSQSDYYFNVWPNNLVNILLIIVLFILYCYILNKINLFNKNTKVNFISLLLTICLTIGNIYDTGISITNIFSIITFLLFIIKIIGFYYLSILVIMLIKCIFKFIDKYKFKYSNCGFNKLFDKHPYLVSMSLIFLSLIIYYIVYYPSIIDTDPILQIIQFLNNKVGGYVYHIELKDILDYSNHYPICHTMLLGYFFYVGRLLVNDNFGLFLYVLVQGIVFAYTYARTIVFLKKRNIKHRYLYFMLIFYMITPMYGFYVLDLNKDVYYSFIMMHLVMDIIDVVENNKLSICKFFVFLLLFILLYLLRNNGFYIALLTLPFLIIFIKKYRKAFLLLLIIMIGFNFSYHKYVLPYFNVKEGSKREALSIIF